MVPFCSHNTWASPSTPEGARGPLVLSCAPPVLTECLLCAHRPQPRPAHEPSPNSLLSHPAPGFGHPRASYSHRHGTVLERLFPPSPRSHLSQPSSNSLSLAAPLHVTPFPTVPPVHWRPRPGTDLELEAAPQGEEAAPAEASASLRDHRKVAARSAGPGPAGWGSLGRTEVLDPDPDLPQSGGGAGARGRVGGLPTV